MIQLRPMGRLLRAAIVCIVVALALTVACNASGTWNADQLRKIDTSMKEFSFAVFGDTRDSKGMDDKLIAKTEAEGALFNLEVGDFVSHGTKAEYDAFLAKASGQKTPRLLAIGNHDFEWGGDEKNYLDLIGERYYSFTVGDAYFIVLDINVRLVDEPQLAWLREELQKSAASKYRFVFFHTALYDPSEEEYMDGHNLRDLELSKRLTAIFDDGRVTMIFAGHIHGYFSGVWGKTPYTITGGGGVVPVGLDKKHFFHHFIKVTVSDSGVSYRVVKF